jgi:hypothetical protein
VVVVGPKLTSWQSISTSPQPKRFSKAQYDATVPTSFPASLEKFHSVSSDAKIVVNQDATVLVGDEPFRGQLIWSGAQYSHWTFQRAWYLGGLTGKLTFRVFLPDFRPTAPAGSFAGFHREGELKIWADGKLLYDSQPLLPKTTSFVEVPLSQVSFLRVEFRGSATMLNPIIEKAG